MPTSPPLSTKRCPTSLQHRGGSVVRTRFSRRPTRKVEGLGPVHGFKSVASSAWERSSGNLEAATAQKPRHPLRHPTPRRRLEEVTSSRDWESVALPVHTFSPGNQFRVLSPRALSPTPSPSRAVRPSRRRLGKHKTPLTCGSPFTLLLLPFFFLGRFFSRRGSSLLPFVWIQVAIQVAPAGRCLLHTRHVARESARH